eukprot:155771-Prorocentrum_lima.AAC.1
MKVGGSLDYHRMVAGLKSGPASLEEFCKWPPRMIQDIMAIPGGGVRVQRASALLERGHAV